MASNDTPKKNRLLNQIKKSVVFLGTIDEEGHPQYCGTGFLVDVEKNYHLVTAKHLIMEMRDNKFTGKLADNDLHVFFNAKNNVIKSRTIKELKTQFDVDWIFHDNNEVDVAIIPFGLDPKSDDVKVIPDNLFLDIDRLFELYDIFFLSYQPGITSQNKVSSVIRTGTVSLINDDKTFYIDASAFPGNSGSPVFLRQSFARFDETKNAIIMGNDPLEWKFVGIVGGYIPYREVAISVQTKRPRIIFEENTGLSRVWSTSFLSEIIESPKFKKQINKPKIKKRK